MTEGSFPYDYPFSTALADYFRVIRREPVDAKRLSDFETYHNEEALRVWHLMNLSYQRGAQDASAILWRADA